MIISFLLQNVLLITNTILSIELNWSKLTADIYKITKDLNFKYMLFWKHFKTSFIVVSLLSGAVPSLTKTDLTTQT